MARQSKQVQLFFVEVIMRDDQFVGKIAAGEDLASPQAYTVASNISSVRRFEIFCELVQKIQLARRKAQDSISVLVSDTNHILRDESFKIQPILSSTHPSRDDGDEEDD